MGAGQGLTSGHDDRPVLPAASLPEFERLPPEDSDLSRSLGEVERVPKEMTGRNDLPQDDPSQPPFSPQKLI